MLQDEVLVLGRLTAGSITKTQFGNSSITRNKNTGDVISLGDDLKAATTDSLKKAATLLGVGLSLYAGNNSQQNRTAQQLPVNGKQGIPINMPGGGVQTPNYPPNNYSGKSNVPSNDNSKRLSSKQLGYLNSIAKDKAITQQELNNLAIQKFGTQVGFLSKKDASLFINELISAQNAA